MIDGAPVLRQQLMRIALAFAARPRDVRAQLASWFESIAVETGDDWYLALAHGISVDARITAAVTPQIWN